MTSATSSKHDEFFSCMGVIVDRPAISTCMQHSCNKEIEHALSCNWFNHYFQTCNMNSVIACCSVKTLKFVACNKKLYLHQFYKLYNISWNTKPFQNRELSVMAIQGLPFEVLYQHRHVQMYRAIVHGCRSLVPSFFL